MDTNNRVIPKRIASSVIQSLKGGVVPRIGLPYITVGRKNEIDALLHDVDIISEGGASCRFIEGRYGSGKSFLIQTIRNYVMDRGFVVMDADLSPERRLYGNKGQGLATYKELIQNMSVKSRPEGGALSLILDKWIQGVSSALIMEGVPSDNPSFTAQVEKRIFQVISSMNDLVHGFDFARILTIYYRSYAEGDEALKAAVIKWFRGEYVNKTEAKRELGVGIIVTDDDWYEYMKLFAYFFKQAGYSGLMVMIDELVNIYKIPNAITRQYNYEKILTIYNDTLQGKARYLGFIMCGTPQAIEDQRRGVYSYEALRSRLSQGKFSGERLRDMLAPVILLEPLTAEEMLVLCDKLADIHKRLYDWDLQLSDEDLAVFIRIEYGRIGADSHITPREVIRDFIELLDILYQHPGLDVEALLSSDEFSYAKDPLAQQEDEAVLSIMADDNDRDEGFAEFTL
ncbi:ATP-binding protein [Butyrivibrio sp. MC2013]|uniref:ATP-binding protein n=1 Tax=Butyrivibrio sp. MC2013 TaxID=1280686 RepID=UPI000422C405|nr:ATP-binding protein [Butyrivibrio sp. MC2013]